MLHDYDLTVHALPCLFEMSRVRAQELIKKYIRFKPDLIEKKNYFLQKYCSGKYVLGVCFKKMELLIPVDNQAFIDALKYEIAQLDKEYVVVIITDDMTFFQDLLKNNIYQIASPLLDKNMQLTVRGEYELLGLSILAHADKVIGVSATALKLLGHFNANLPIVEFAPSWFEQ